jgi:hypothetical protein
MPDTKLWAAKVGGQEIRAEQHHLHATQDSAHFFNAELRVTRNGETVVSEVFFDQHKLQARSMEIFETLVSKKLG